jgi:capsular exopolysaccharide synthesis family protein
VVTQAKEQFLRQQVDALKAQVAKSDAAEVDVRALERETEGDRNLLTQLVARLNDTKAQIKLQGAEARVISAATVPRTPTFPPTMAITAAAILLSAAGASIIVVLLERGDDTIRSMAQIRELTPARILGTVPLVKQAKSDGRIPQRHILARQRSHFTESLRAISFQIDRAWTPPAKVLLITSSVSSEGKSSFAACLARVMALSGRRVVLVDADLRNPTLHRTFALAKSPGLADLAHGKRSLYQIVQFDRASSASVITAGDYVESPADTLQSRQIATLFQNLAMDFDTVIIDSPPFLAVNDASILAQYADATIAVVRWGSTTTATLITALQRMSDLKVRLSGIVMSMVDSRKYERHGYTDSAFFSRSFRKYYQGT